MNCENGAPLFLKNTKTGPPSRKGQMNFLVYTNGYGAPEASKKLMTPLVHIYPSIFPAEG